MKIVCMVCGRQKAGTSGDPVSHGLCARCESATEDYRGGSVEEIKNDKNILKDLKENIQEEISGNIKWLPPENDPDWKDKEFNKDDLDFYEGLKREVESEIKLGLKR